MAQGTDCKAGRGASYSAPCTTPAFSAQPLASQHSRSLACFGQRHTRRLRRRAYGTCQRQNPQTPTKVTPPLHPNTSFLGKGACRLQRHHRQEKAVRQVLSVGSEGFPEEVMGTQRRPAAIQAGVGGGRA